MSSNNSASTAGSPKIDIVDFQRRQRQFLNELKMKRDQVTQLKKELDPASLKIHELTRSLESAKITIEEQQHNLNLALKNSRFLEDKLQAKRDYTSRTHMQQEFSTQERDSLREQLQKTELQNYNLIRELNELKAQQNCDVVYQKDLISQDAKVRAKIAELAEAIQKLQDDQNEITELRNKINVWEDLQISINFYRDELHKCKNNYLNLEKKFLVNSAALQKLEKLSILEIQASMNQETDVVVSQWKKSTDWYNQQIKMQEAVIENLTKTLKAEKETNEKICIHEAEMDTRNHALMKENEELRAKLNSLVKDHTDVEVQTAGTDNLEITPKDDTVIKTEVIEIFDE